MAAAKKASESGQPHKLSDSSGSSPQTIMDIARMIRDGSLDPVEFIEKVINEVESIDKDYHYMNELCKDQAIAQAREIKTKSRTRLPRASCLAFLSLSRIASVSGVSSQEPARRSLTATTQYSMLQSSPISRKRERSSSARLPRMSLVSAVSQSM